MKQIIKESDLIGKTIKSVHFPGESEGCIVFADETFAIIVDDSYDEKSIALFQSYFNPDPDIYNYSSLYELGLITKQERDKWEILKNKKNREDEEASEKAKLLHLAKKYPDILNKK
jgi:hypothetical protein